MALGCAVTGIFHSSFSKKVCVPCTNNLPAHIDVYGNYLGGSRFASPASITLEGCYINPPLGESKL